MKLFAFACLPECDLSNVHTVRKVVAIYKLHLARHCHLFIWANLACRTWCRWQAANLAAYGAGFAGRLANARRESRHLPRLFLGASHALTPLGAAVAFERPATASA